MANFPVNNILFLDIETVPQYSSYNDLPEDWRQLWDIKSNTLSRNQEGQTSEMLYPRAGIYAEFGKIVCISCGVVQGRGEQQKIILKSFSGDNEKELLQQFNVMLNNWVSGEQKLLQ